MRDRKFIEPYWTTSALSWEQRHTRAWWIREYLRQRRARAMHRSLALSVLVDGEFAGQCNLSPIDPRNRSAELGIWLDSRHAGHGVGAVAGALIGDYAFRDLGLHRITAPVCVGNRAARHQVKLAGMSHEATMIRAISVNGQRRDHELWAVTADRAPAGGYLAALIAAGVGAQIPSDTGGSTRTSWAERWHDAVAASPATVLAVTAWYYLGAPFRPHETGSAAVALPPRLTVREGGGPPVILRKRTPPWQFRFTGRVRYDAFAADDALGWIGLDCRGQNVGLAIELDGQRSAESATALRRVVDYAFGRLGIERLETVVDPSDAAVTALASAGGLLREGVLTGARIDSAGTIHDVEVWGLTDDNHSAQTGPEG
ncbi:GNAT family N-acetyltransferase [Nocardia huaxiensis]|uniref:GNAT family N-acetyltransferase n=1 Tax=Nocardia huaxiensis TaxID=2755382 RepID=UPI001E2ED232|nr:GNAT family protein [Nocardia huaxiensis]UFS98895.1 GNAT family N-acetyltransferase [Nocardia huaxiensis]